MCGGVGTNPVQKHKRESRQGWEKGQELNVDYAFG